MISYDAPHQVTDQDKFTALVNAFRVGENVPAVVVFETAALTGSHRVAAYESARRAWERGEDGYDVEPTLDTVEVDEDEFFAALAVVGFEREEDWRLSGAGCNVDPNSLCEALYNVTSDDSLKAALEDQRGW